MSTRGFQIDRRGFVLATLASLAARPALAAAGPIRVLIIDGVSNHDWRLTTRLLRAILEPTGLFDVTVSTSPPTAAAPGWDGWRPGFGNADVILQTYNDIWGGPAWPEPVKSQFEAFVARGGGVFFLHSANNAFPDWPAYNEMIGLGWREKDFGPAVYVDEEGRQAVIPAGTGEGTAHGPRYDSQVRRIGDHPVHAGLPRAWITADVELYRYARGPARNLEILTYAREPETQMNWPMEWTVRYGQGRCYIANYGHVWAGDADPVTLRSADVQTILVRALQWLARREVTWPVPADFPTAEAVSIRAPLR
jgi:hypothetical protein